MATTLNQVPPGKVVKVESVSADALQSKLTDMGIYPGQEVKILYKAPLGDPIAIEVGDFTLSLRISEASLIQIES